MHLTLKRSYEITRPSDRDLRWHHNNREGLRVSRFDLWITVATVPRPWRRL